MSTNNLERWMHFEEFTNTLITTGLPSAKMRKYDAALNKKPIRELQSIICHMGSQSVNCHPK